MARFTRYQGAIVRDDEILLLYWQESSGVGFWLFPGGGREPGESAHEAVRREMAEETHLRVRVERLLLEMPAHERDAYDHVRTYLCRVEAGEARPGSEPELKTSGDILAVRWFDLRNEHGWPEALRRDAITYPTLQQVRGVLGYIERPPAPW